LEFIRQYQEPKDWSDKHAQKIERVQITKSGKTFDLYDYIQEQREDTEIYPTLEKYGNIEKLERPAREIYTDLTNALDLRGLFDQDKKLQALFYSLPLEERKEFDQDFYTFKEKGLDFYLAKAEKEIKDKQQQQQQQQKQQQQDNGGKE